MSLHHSETIICPSCHTEQSVLLWDSVNVQTDPELKEKLLSGKLFCFSCANCGAENKINQALLYHDPEKHLLIWSVLHPEDAAEINNIGSVNLFDSLELGPECRHRIALTRNELFELIHVYDAGLDDRLVAFMKIIMNGMLRKQKIESSEILFLGMEADGAEKKLSFHIRDVNGTCSCYALPYAMYADLEKNLVPRFPPNTPDFIHLGREWFDGLVKN